MLSSNSNINIVVGGLLQRMVLLQQTDPLLRTVATSMQGVVGLRIYNDGKNANDNQIGTYSEEYLKVRQKKHNRTADKKVILSLTRQEENDFKVVATPTGYGLGYSNSFNYRKAQWHEKQYGKIFGLTISEEKQTIAIANSYIENALLN